MCGRFALATTPAEVRDIFNYEETPNFPPRYNIAPTQPIATVRLENGERAFRLVRWGLIPSWVKEPDGFTLLINARSETAAEKPAFRAAMRRRRCLVPASGFYEWRKVGKGAKQPYWVAPREGGVIAFAGLWESWAGKDGSDIETGAILTTSANAALKHIHHRMPVVIGPKDFDLWLSGEAVSTDEAASLLRPAADEFFASTPVSTRVNAVRNDDADLTDPVDAVEEDEARETSKKKPPADGQLSLL